MADIMSKKDFAALIGVSRGRISQFVDEKKISGPAIVGEGRHARINAPVAIDQLDRNLDLSQRTGMNGRAKLDTMPRPAKPATAQSSQESSEQQSIEEKIKRERLDQLAMANAKSREEAAARAGRYVLAEEARQEMGRIAGQMMAMFEGALGELAGIVAGNANLSPRDVAHWLRTGFHEIRIRSAKTARKEADSLPKMMAQFALAMYGAATLSIPAAAAITAREDGVRGSTLR
jgi:hypothetical protein